LLGAIAPEMKECEGVVRVINVPAVRDGDYLHVYMDASTRKGMGVFGPRQNGKPGGEQAETANQIPRLESDV
jgi:hypothetical protein